MVKRNKNEVKEKFCFVYVNFSQKSPSDKTFK